MKVEAAVVSFCMRTEDVGKELERILVTLNQNIGWIFVERNDLESNRVRSSCTDLIGSKFVFHFASMPAVS